MEFDGKKVLAKPNGNTYDIIDALLKITPDAIKQVKPKLNKLVKITGDAYKDALEIAKYVRKNVTYKADGYENQNIQLPGRLVNNTKKGDCKSFSLLFCAMMNAAGHKAGYRFASYRANKIPTHVYNWMLYKNKLFTFDTCVSNLKESPRHTYTIDMNVNYLTGYPEPEYIGRKRLFKKGFGKKLFKGFKKIALAGPRNAFRSLVFLNVRGLATSLSKAIAKDKNKVKDFWEKLGGKYDGKNSLMQSINKGKSKKALFGSKKNISGINGFEEDPYIGLAVPAALASAAPILIAIKKLLKDLNVEGEEGEEGRGGSNVISPEEEQEATESGNKISDPNFVAADDENIGGGKTLTTGFKPSPILIGGVLGAGVLIYLLTKKKK
jgi:hypothetical protein